jgi:hypothetical protein
MINSLGFKIKKILFGNYYMLIWGIDTDGKNRIYSTGNSNAQEARGLLEADELCMREIEYFKGKNVLDIGVKTDDSFVIIGPNE